MNNHYYELVLGSPTKHTKYDLYIWSITAADLVKPMDMTGWVIVDYVFWVPSKNYTGKYHCITKNYKKPMAMNGLTK